jgi:membrane-bound lytic murein transglycosylase MltF
MVVAFLVSLSSLWAFSSEPSRQLTPYDSTFIGTVSRWMPDYDYVWLISQCKQESNLDPFAVSSAGAEGYCQFMSGTWVDCQLALGILGASRFDPEKSIKCAGWYMNGRINVWRGRDRQPLEKLPLAQASYNCGTGCVLKAQRRCNDGRLMEDISPCLPEETQQYPIFIKKHYNRFKETTQ